MKKAVIFTYGRMNPPTIGHLELIGKLMEEAQRLNADFKVFVTQTQNREKNPLYANEKLNILRELAPGVPVEMVPMIPGKKGLVQASPYFLTNKFMNNGYEQVYMMVGSNRMGNFKGLKATKISAGNRDPNSNNINVKSVSATKARNAAKNKNVNTFRRIVPVKNPEPLMDKIRSRLV